MSDTSSFPPLAQPRRIGLFLFQLVLGVVVGALLALCGGWIGPLLTNEASNGWSDLVGSVLGALAGYALGAPLGVIAAAAVLRQRGRPLFSMLGGILGGVAVLLLAEPLRLNQESSVLVLVFALVVLAGALLGFYIRRRPGA
jgi:outer membrane lipoprotein SlyB